MIFSYKRAQEGGRAATLVAVIAGLLLLYLLFLPPADRARLLGENITKNGTIIQGGVEVLLLEHPGKLDYVSATTIEKPLPSLVLFTKTQAKQFKKIDSFIIKNGWFSKKDMNTVFLLSDLDHSENMKLSFNLETMRGALFIDVNGKRVFESEITAFNQIIDVPKDVLRSGENTLTFSVSSVGAAFWRTNTYEIQDLLLVADTTDTSRETARSTLILSTTENNNVESVALRFMATYPCSKQADISTLLVTLNGHTVYTQTPVCDGDLVRQQISPNFLNTGENILEFKTRFSTPTTASYDIDQIQLKLALKEPSPPVYFFTMTQSQLTSVTKGKKAMLRMLFADQSQKSAEIYVNGHLVHLETKAVNMTKDISYFVKEGNNAIKIVPKSMLEIIDLEVRVE